MLTAIQVLLARDEIRHVMGCYNTSGDTGRQKEFAEVFTEDAELIAPGLNLQTRDGIIAGLFQKSEATQKSQLKFKVYRHHLTTSKIEITSSTTARGRTYFLVITDVGLDHTGVYTDEFRKESQGWRISRREVRLDHVAPQSLQFSS
jgi:SnoaL-like domain